MALRLLRVVLVRLVLLALALAFVVYVWPTRFKYDHLSTEGNTYPVRIDRINGNSDMLVPDEGWIPVEGQDGSGSEAAPTPRTAARCRNRRRLISSSALIRRSSLSSSTLGL